MCNIIIIIIYVFFLAHLIKGGFVRGNKHYLAVIVIHSDLSIKRVLNMAERTETPYDSYVARRCVIVHITTHQASLQKHVKMLAIDHRVIYGRC